MNRLCVRCAHPPSSLLAFDYDRKATWLFDFEAETPRRGGHPLCERHANRFTPPLGWALDDRRRDMRTLFAAAEIG